MFALGLAMQGKLYTSAQDILGLLGMAGDLGSGLALFREPRGGPGRAAHPDHGCRLRQSSSWWRACLNIIAAVDAHNLRTGRKS
jgi:hypothetical protein